MTGLLSALRWHYADGILTITTEHGVSASTGGDFAEAAVNEIARIAGEGRPLDDLLAGLFLCGCASEQGLVTVQGHDGLPRLPARAARRGQAQADPSRPGGGRDGC